MDVEILRKSRWNKYETSAAENTNSVDVIHVLFPLNGA